MPEMPESAKRLLAALVEIEQRAIVHARLNGCKCSAEVPDGDGRTFPIAIFDRNKVVGKPFHEIPWQMRHEPGCPMDGQEGVG